MDVGDDDVFASVSFGFVASPDVGDNWSNEGTVTGGGVGDVRLAGSEAGAPTLYAALRDGAGWHLHRSDDAGANWTWVSDIPDFWGTLAASISDPSSRSSAA